MKKSFCCHSFFLHYNRSKFPEWDTAIGWNWLFLVFYTTIKTSICECVYGFLFHDYIPVTKSYQSSRKELRIDYLKSLWAFICTNCVLCVSLYCHRYFSCGTTPTSIGPCKITNKNVSLAKESPLVGCLF